jgi:uncharacterized RDD family membrane protein YckC
MTERRRRQVVEEEPLLFDLPLAAPPPADRRARTSPRPAPVQVDLFAAEGGEEELEAIDDDAAADDHDDRTAAMSAVGPPDRDDEAASESPSGPVVAGLTSRFLAGVADAILHLGVLGAAYLGVLALGIEPGPADWPAFAILVVAFSFLSSVVSLAFWGQTAGMAWRRLQTRDRLQRPLTFRQAALRWAGGLLTFATAGLPLLFLFGGASLADWISRSVTYSMAAPAPQRP